ncbi:hypothetical protein EBME_1093 [bacterium endosymbiont of Mortierella elongata FMR23-6]|nr:hypothetical protein EBME_1093 [bacterium endosymbiont of Mortierella elongata FMR23-6]
MRVTFSRLWVKYLKVTHNLHWLPLAKPGHYLQQKPRQPF